MFESLLHLVFISASVIAASIFVFLALSTVGQFVRWFLLRRKPWWLRTARGTRETAKISGMPSNQMTRLALLCAIIGLAAKAVLTGGLLIGAYLVIVGVALYLFLGRQAYSTAREQISNSIGELVAAYYSSYLVVPTVFNALAEAARTITNPQLQSAVQRTLDAFGAGRTTEEALNQLVAEVRDPYIAQLVFILRHTSESNQTEILAALQSLGKRLDQRKRLKDRSRVALALVSGTVRFLQSANGAVIALAVLAPFWWDFYASSISHQSLLMIGATIALMGSWYFENQLQQLRERVL